MLLLNDEEKQKAVLAKQAKIAYAKEHLDLEWVDPHWKELAKKYSFRLPPYYQSASDTRYIKRMFKHVGLEIKEYLEVVCGMKTLKELVSLNPRMTALTSVGFALEWVDEVKTSVLTKNS